MQVVSPSINRRQSITDVLNALLGIGRQLRHHRGPEAIDPGTFWLLRTLHAHGPMRVTDLAAGVGLDPSTVSRHLAQLHRAGLVERASDPDDRRAQRVRISESGLAGLDAAFTARRAALEHSLDGWSDRDVEQLQLLLTRAVADLDSAGRGPE